MIRVLYIGNHLSHAGACPSVAETMAPLLLPEVKLRLVSRHKSRILRLADMLFSILRHGRSEQPVVLDVYSTANFYYSLACAVLCRLTHIPYGCVLHGGNLPERLQKHPGYCRVLFRNSWVLITPSPYLKHVFAQAGYPTRVIPNFIFIENYPFRLRTAIRPRLLWVRAFDAIYNPQMAVRALRRLSEIYPDAVLYMVGPDKDGSLGRCKALAAELGVSTRIHFTGRLSKPDWIALSADCDIFINTTNIDNTPVSVIEALALGLPVVSTNVGGIPFLLAHARTGLLSDPNDPDSLVRHIVTLIEDPETGSRLSSEGRKQAEALAWEQIKSSWLEVLGRTE